MTQPRAPRPARPQRPPPELDELHEACEEAYLTLQAARRSVEELLVKAGEQAELLKESGHGHIAGLMKRIGRRHARTHGGLEGLATEISDAGDRILEATEEEA